MSYMYHSTPEILRFHPIPPLIFPLQSLKVFRTQRSEWISFVSKKIKMVPTFFVKKHTNFEFQPCLDTKFFLYCQKRKRKIVEGFYFFFKCRRVPGVIRNAAKFLTLCNLSIYKSKWKSHRTLVIDNNDNNYKKLPHYPNDCIKYLCNSYNIYIV